MKKTLIALFAFFVVFVASAISVKLAWNQTCDTNVAGYIVYYDTVSPLPTPTVTTGIDVCVGTSYDSYSYLSSFSNTVEVDGVTNTSVCISNLSPGTTYVFSVAAFYANSVQSLLSSQIYMTTPPSYVPGGTPPTLNMNTVLVWITNWYNPPLVRTNKINGKVSTNYYSATPYVRQLQADMFIPTNWSMLSKTDLLSPTWSIFAQGSNNLVQLPITNTGGNIFFRLKIGN